MDEFWHWLYEFQPFSVPLLLLAAFGALVLVGAPFVALKEALDKAAAKRKASKAAQRQPMKSSKPAPATGGDPDNGPDYWATGTYDPQRYYSETRGWSVEYRDYIRDAYGDLDTYEANHPD
jgi:hypothetical protein